MRSKSPALRLQIVAWLLIVIPSFALYYSAQAGFDVLSYILLALVGVGMLLAVYGH